MYDRIEMMPFCSENENERIEYLTLPPPHTGKPNHPFWTQPT